MLKVLHSTDRNECIKFMESVFQKPNPIIMDSIRSLIPKSITVHWNDVLGNGVVSFCYHVITKTERDYQWVAESFDTEDLKNVS